MGDAGGPQALSMPFMSMVPHQPTAVVQCRLKSAVRISGVSLGNRQLRPWKRGVDLRSARTRAARGRQGFTLIEILVSLMILSIVSVAMLGILLTATELYRRGQASRSAHDELVAVAAAMDHDIARIVPGRDGGWMRARVIFGFNHGGMVVSMLTTTADLAGIKVINSNEVTGRRHIVIWWINDQDELRRHELDEPLPTGAQTRAQAFAAALPNQNNLNDPDYGKVMTTGCLHFSLVASMADQPRKYSQNWDPGFDTSTVQPVPSPDPATIPVIYDRHDYGAMPETVAIRLILTGGGRFAPRGFVVRDDTDTIRIAGVRSYPTIPGSLARIGTGTDSEWVSYRSAGPGVLDVSETLDMVTGRARLYSTSYPRPTGAEPKAPIRFGQLVTMVRGIPR